MRLSTDSISSHETQGSELQQQGALAEDEQQQQTVISADEPTDQSGIIGFTE